MAKENIRKQSIQSDYTTVGNIQGSHNLVNGGNMDDGLNLDYSAIQVNLNQNSSVQRKKSLDITNESTSFQNQNNMYKVETNEININKFKSSNNPTSNLMDIDFTKINSSDRKSSNMTNQVSVSESVSSLNNIDLGSVLSSINLVGNENFSSSPINLEDKKENSREQSSNLRNRAVSSFNSFDFSKGGFNNLPQTEVNTMNSMNFSNQYNLNNSNMSMAFNQPVNSSFQMQNNFNQNNSMYNKPRQSQDLFGLNNLLLSSSQMEDIFDPNTIKKQIRGVIIVSKLFKI
jgi:hypothetical protein